MSDFRVAAKRLLHGHELLAEEVEKLGDVHNIHLFRESAEALAKVALAGERQMIFGVVTAELLAAQGDGAAAFSCGGHNESALTDWD